MGIAEKEEEVVGRTVEGFEIRKQTGKRRERERRKKVGRRIGRIREKRNKT